jgi:hypothetical protein
MTSNHIPQKVLSQQLGEKINGRRVRTAVFTTYTFDPGFFELHVLPILFDKPFHQVEKVRRIQMEEAIRSLDEIAVYYDRTALSQEAQPAQLDFRRIDVRRATGAFHPKLILLLVENNPMEGEDPDPDDLSLIVAALSANLTRAGWWENVETGHIDEILNRDDPASRTSFRQDVLGMMHRLKRCCADDENHAALDRIHDFLIRRANRTPIKQITVNYRYNTRLFCGQKSLPDMLQDLKLDRYCENLEIISPYFDKSPANTLQRVIDAVDAQRVRVFLPENADGSAAVSEETYAAIARIENVEWARLPNEMLFTGGRKNIDNMPPRRVHAKVYRFWQKGGWNVTLVGSVNLTSAGHSHSSAGNLEAAFLYDISGKGFDNRWWLEPLERAAGVFAADQPREDDEGQKVPLNVSFRYDWAAGALSYRAEDGATGPIEVYEPGGVYLFAINRLQGDGWVDCGSEAAGKVSELLRSTSFLEIRHARGKWRILIREEGMHQRPSLMISLTPEEILMYWSLLSPEQQEYFLAEKLSKEANLQGMDPVRSNRYIVNDTVFDRFAGVYHAFEQLVGYVTEAIDQGKEREAKARLFGAKYDSLPQLLEKTLMREGADDVMVYITFLCAQQARNRVASIYPDFIAAGGKDLEVLDQLLGELPAIRSRLSPYLTDSTEFLKWYEQMFLQMIQQPDSGEGA